MVKMYILEGWLMLLVDSIGNNIGIFIKWGRIGFILMQNGISSFKFGYGLGSWWVV